MRTPVIRFIFAMILMTGLFGSWIQVHAQAPGKTVNVELILDASGSMAERLDSGETRIEAAKTVLTDVINELPEKEGVNVGMRVYGHKGSNNESGKTISCQSSQQVVPIQGVDKAALQTQVDAYQPVGWTPLALSLTRSAADFPKADANTVNAVVLVTDGLETCGGDPCAASRQIKNGPQAVTTHVIGFALDDTERANLQCIVDASGGLLLGAGDAGELSDALFAVLQQLEVVAANGFIVVEQIGDLFPKATIQQLAKPANDSTPAPTPAATPDADLFHGVLTSSNRIEVPEGTYDVSWPNPAGTVSHVTVAVVADQTTYIRGSILRFPHGGAESYRLTDQTGLVIWEAPIQFGDAVWVVPGIYRLQLVELTGTAMLLSMDVQTLPGKITEVTVLTSP
ncbi:MAG TPA: VWA domain-containing protein [Thermomicrobiales bacterium]|nr:VWA domain-containing protein [Thermomicrobiales bacterium]